MVPACGHRRNQGHYSATRINRYPRFQSGEFVVIGLAILPCFVSGVNASLNLDFASIRTLRAIWTNGGFVCEGTWPKEMVRDTGFEPVTPTVSR